MHGIILAYFRGRSRTETRLREEGERPDPRAVMGLFDLSARPNVGRNLLTFALPCALFGRMGENIPESFPGTGTWEKIRKRIRG